VFKIRGLAKRAPRPTERRETVRRLTVTAATLAAALNAILFVQTSAVTFGAGSVQDAIVSAVNTLFPRGGLQPPANPTPGATPVAVSGGS
jgi:hypothetical protein